MFRSLIDSRYVNQGRILKLEVFLQIVHFVRDFVKLGDAVFAKIVHRGLCVVNVDEMLLLFGAFLAKLWVQLVALERCDTFFVEL